MPAFKHQADDQIFHCGSAREMIEDRIAQHIGLDTVDAVRALRERMDILTDIVGNLVERAAIGPSEWPELTGAVGWQIDHGIERDQR